MLRVGPYFFKRAETGQEFEEIHRLNHRTFVEEIPQHAATESGLLIDKFHHKNSYFIVVRAGRLVGMVSTHDQAPFSVADRLPEPEILTQPGTKPLEVRLLAIEPDERNSTLFAGLVWGLYEYARAEGYTHLYISGVEERVDLYERLGFVALGPAVPCGNAAFVPMVMTIGQLPMRIERFKKLWESHLGHVTNGSSRRAFTCLLPGPVTMSANVQSAFREAPIYHRGSEFISRFVKVREFLGQLVGGRDVALLNGSGTLGNEAVAATLAAEAQGRPSPSLPRGIMLVNGEFGERLARQASRFGLRPRVLSWSWGTPWDLREVEIALAQEPRGSWVWGVHQESSTGVLNDLPGLVRLAKNCEVRVCVDCISSLGAVPLDLSEVYLATGATGKALGSYAGAAIVFADRRALKDLDCSNVPSCLDLPAALANDGPCYTFPSPTLRALEAALDEYDGAAKAQAVYHRYRELGLSVRRHLSELGFCPLAKEEWASPVVTTFAPPDGESSEQFVQRCRSWGFTIGGESAYLSQRRLVQIATMGAISWEMVAPLFESLRQVKNPHPQELTRNEAQ
jgi:aspartate aminotransferase-like enzyme